MLGVDGPEILLHNKDTIPDGTPGFKVIVEVILNGVDKATFVPEYENFITAGEIYSTVYADEIVEALAPLLADTSKVIVNDVK